MTDTFKPHFPRSEPDDVVDSSTLKATLGCGNVYIVIDKLNDKPYRVFLKKGHTGVCKQSLLEAVGRLITIILQSADIPIDRVMRTLRGITCEKGIVGRLSCLDVLAQHLSKNKEK